MKLTVYEAGIRSPKGVYTRYFESPDLKAVEENLTIMVEVVPKVFEIVRIEKTYELVSTVPHIVRLSEE